MNNDVKNIKYHELKRFEYNTQPKVSVIIPCYNVEKYIDRCLNSLIHQTLKNIEIICIDDKSTDFTLKKLLKYAKQDPRIIVIPQKKNSGAAIARNIGIEHTRGRYIGFVDADDYVDKDFYEKLYITAIKNKAQIAKGNAKILDVEARKIQKIISITCNVDELLKVNDSVNEMVKKITLLEQALCSKLEIYEKILRENSL